MSTPAPPPAAPAPAVDAARMVNGPAIALIVTAAIGMVLGVLSMLGSVLNIGMMGAGGGMSQLEGMEGAEWVAPLMSGTVGIITAIIGIAVGAFIIYAMLQMKGLKSYGAAMAATILAMIPCISPCCILGLPFGIWSLVVLLKPEVKAAFG